MIVEVGTGGGGWHGLASFAPSLGRAVPEVVTVATPPFQLQLLVAGEGGK